MTRQVRWLRPLALALLLLGSSLALGQSTHKLFVIERSKNRNQVHYDARLGTDGQLDPKEPVVAYWVLLPSGKRESLGWVERKKAYGFSIVLDKSGQFWRMKLVPAEDRPIKVYVKDGKARAEMTISGRAAYLTKLYIDSTEGVVLPTVNYVDLFGVDLANGASVRERLVPK
jgi:hypothetical protein